jgi:hypothetical protein
MLWVHVQWFHVEHQAEAEAEAEVEIDNYQVKY